MNKTQLQSNNTRLASLIDELKGKAAGGGSSGGGNVETCTVTFTAMPPVEEYSFVSYVDFDGVLHTEEGIYSGDSITIPKNTIIYVSNSNCSPQGKFTYAGPHVLYIYGDCAIKAYG